MSPDPINKYTQRNKGVNGGPIGFSSLIHKPLAYTSQMPSLVVQRPGPQRGLSLVWPPTSSHPGGEAEPDTDTHTLMITQNNNLKNEQPGHREGSQGGGIGIEEGCQGQKERGSRVPKR